MFHKRECDSEETLGVCPTAGSKCKVQGPRLVRGQG